MIVDEARVTLEAGHGGPGKVSFYKKGQRGPDGGGGGRGGDIILRATSDLTALNRFAGKDYFKVPDGEPGQSNQKAGRNAPNLELTIPVGTLLTDTGSGETFELTAPGETLLICKGGLGGLGNFALRSARNTTPLKAQTGLPGQKRVLKMSLRFLANFGLVGLPNSGKSSLLNELTAANARVGNYPFTTLEPNLGVLNGKIIADIPGLIAGAAEGKGLGDKFLKHAEKVSLLLHTISVESEDPQHDYQVVRAELEKYNPEFLNKREIILLTKSDLVDSVSLTKKMTALKKLKRSVLPVSVHDWDSLEVLKKKLLSL